MAWDSIKHSAHGVFKRATESVTGPLKKSQFEEKKVLTPDEFVAAGDYLVRACPTWAWQGGDPKKRRSYFPAEKQFLVTRNVPCLRRAADMEAGALQSEYALGGDEDGWVATHRDPALAGTGGADEEAIPSLDEPNQGEGAAAAAAGKEGDDDDDCLDISELELGEADDEAALPSTAGHTGYLRAEEPDDNIVKTRTYDLYITYDQYYQVPRLWLVGFDESRQPLHPNKVLEDVSEDHARKTITLDPHPNLSMSAASIHPCRHAEVMSRLVDNLVEAGKDFSAEHYLVLFLKFIASVVPTIQYDYTMSVGN